MYGMGGPYFKNEMGSRFGAGAFPEQAGGRASGFQPGTIDS